MITKLHLKSGFNQLVIEPESRYITTFCTHVWMFRYKRLSLEFNAASEIFQREISQLICGNKFSFGKQHRAWLDTRTTRRAVQRRAAPPERGRPDAQRSKVRVHEARTRLLRPALFGGVEHGRLSIEESDSLDIGEPDRRPRGVRQHDLRHSHAIEHQSSAARSRHPGGHVTRRGESSVASLALPPSDTLHRRSSRRTHAPVSYKEGRTNRPRALDSTLPPQVATTCVSGQPGL